MGRPETGRTGARFGAPARRSRHTTDPETAHGVPVGEPEPGHDDVLAAEEPAADVGLIGARFGGRARRSRKERLAEKAAQAAGAEPVGPASAPEPADPGPARPAPAPVPDDGAGHPTVEMPRVADAPAVAPIAARPYVLTGGRTKVRAELRIETMVSATGPAAGESGERHTVLTLCARPRSVSEVAALTGVPLGVARVLIDDLATEGRLRVHLGVDPNGGPDMGLLDRVLSGLRRL